MEWVRKMADATETVLSVMVTDSASIDTTVLRAWINGLTPRECARLREPDLYRDFFNNTPFDQLKPELKQRWRAAQMLNMQECAEEYQVCEWMSPYMCQPHQVSKKKSQAGHDPRTHLRWRQGCHVSQRLWPPRQFHD